MNQNRLFCGRYRNQTTRLKNWDYSSSGWYFITICTQNREMYFGDVINDEMVLSEMGHAAAGCWLGMSRVYDVLIGDAWVVMPNHVHLLFGINNPDRQKNQNNAFLKMIKNSVSSIINHYKGRVTKYAKKENIPFLWQPRFYDHIVRSKNEFFKIQSYIENNPVNWEEDQFCRQSSF